MPQVEDVRVPPGLRHAVPHRGADLSLGAHEHEGVDVARDRHVGAQDLARLGHVHGPVDTDHVRLHVPLALEVRRPAVGEVDHGRVRALSLDLRDGAVGIRLGESGEVVRADVVRPRLKHLQHLSAALDLVGRVVCDVLRHVLQERVDDLRVVKHHLLRVEHVLVRLALDRVGGEGEGRSDEPQQRRFALHLLAEGGEDRLQEWHRLLRVVDRRQGLHLVHGTDGREDLGAGALDDVELDAHRGQRRQDVREHDHPIGAERAERLQRQLDRDLRRLGPVAERVLFAIRPEFLHVTPRLPHQPHRRPVHLLAASRPEQDVVVNVHRGSGQANAACLASTQPLLQLGRAHLAQAERRRECRR
mmetsp:Transcript_40778/g.96550  ORF Transcript_40778/g.96550 Transcript_40778/m.96550 type:complete len:360 (-) Transcript_40778:76-1155(-)